MGADHAVAEELLGVVDAAIEILVQHQEAVTVGVNLALRFH